MTQEQIIADYKKARHIKDEYVLDEDEMYFVEQIYFLHQEQVKNCSIPLVVGQSEQLVICKKCGSSEMYQHTKTKDKCEDCGNIQDY